MLTDSFSWILIYGGGPGSVNYSKGTARFKNPFFISVISHFFITLTSSIVYRAAIEAVVVAKAGIILPALSFTVTQSNISSL